MTLHCSGDAEAGGSDEGRDSGVYVPGEGLAPGVEPPKEDAIVCFSFLRLLDTLHANPQLSCDFSRAGTPVTAQLNSTEVLYVGTLTLRYPDTRLYRQV